MSAQTQSKRRFSDFHEYINGNWESYPNDTLIDDSDDSNDDVDAKRKRKKMRRMQGDSGEGIGCVNMTYSYIFTRHVNCHKYE